MTIETARLTLRPWRETDAASLYKHAKDPAVGLAAGWPPHGSEADSLATIRNVFCGDECYAVCLKETDEAIGCIELMLGERTDMTERADECELGFWLGQAHWGQGLIPEAAEAILRHAFEDLGMRQVWCGYYDGNVKSRRTQEKLGFVYDHTSEGLPVPLLGEVRTGHANRLSREDWRRRHA